MQLLLFMDTRVSMAVEPLVDKRRTFFLCYEIGHFSRYCLLKKGRVESCEFFTS